MYPSWKKKFHTENVSIHKTVHMFCIYLHTHVCMKLLYVYPILKSARRLRTAHRAHNKKKNGLGVLFTSVSVPNSARALFCRIANTHSISIGDWNHMCLYAALAYECVWWGRVIWYVCMIITYQRKCARFGAVFPSFHRVNCQKPYGPYDATFPFLTPVSLSVPWYSFRHVAQRLHASSFHIYSIPKTTVSLLRFPRRTTTQTESGPAEHTFCDTCNGAWFRRRFLDNWMERRRAAVCKLFRAACAHTHLLYLMQSRKSYPPRFCRRPQCPQRRCDDTPRKSSFLTLLLK